MVTAKPDHLAPTLQPELFLMLQLLPGFRRLLECLVEAGDVRRALDGLGRGLRLESRNGQT
jgi:hypothetical protein